MKHILIILSIGILAQMAYSQTLAQTPTVVLNPLEGFFELSDRFDAATAAHIKKSVFKLYLQKEFRQEGAAHATAFGIRRDGFLLTNAHNVANCLKSHSLESSGYDGSRGELVCNELVLVDAEGRAHQEVTLIASHPLTDIQGRDFAVIRVVDLNNQVLKFSDKAYGNLLTIVGFPSETRRDLQNLDKALLEVNKAIGQTQEFVDRVEQYSGRSKAWLFDLQSAQFHRLVMLVKLATESSFLASAVDDQSYQFSSFQDLSVSQYKKRIRGWSTKVISHLNILSVALEQGRKRRLKDPIGFVYPNADAEMKSSSASLSLIEKVDGRPVMILKADAMPGTSGSPLIDSKGFIAGVIYSVHGNKDKGACSKQALISGFESIKYVYCQDLNFLAIPASQILRQLKVWGI